MGCWIPGPTARTDGPTVELALTGDVLVSGKFCAGYARREKRAEKRGTRSGRAIWLRARASVADLRHDLCVIRTNGKLLVVRIKGGSPPPGGAFAQSPLAPLARAQGVAGEAFVMIMNYT